MNSKSFEIVVGVLCEKIGNLELEISKLKDVIDHQDNKLEEFRERRSIARKPIEE